ncbi:hypothetical protein D3C59_30480 [Streptomyces sp. SHP22-7]|nr:hypothetical protein D3C59_30480 [Streptomyces sp. SHP22-7]
MDRRSRRRTSRSSLACFTVWLDPVRAATTSTSGMGPLAAQRDAHSTASARNAPASRTGVPRSSAGRAASSTDQTVA